MLTFRPRICVNGWRPARFIPPDRVTTALAGFFTEGNLTRLRELAFEEIAYRLDRRQVSQQTGDAPGELRTGYGVPELAKPKRGAAVTPRSSPGRSAERTVVRRLRQNANRRDTFD